MTEYWIKEYNVIRRLIIYFKKMEKDSGVKVFTIVFFGTLLIFLLGFVVSILNKLNDSISF